MLFALAAVAILFALSSMVMAERGKLGVATLLALIGIANVVAFGWLLFGG